MSRHEPFAPTPPIVPKRERIPIEAWIAFLVILQVSADIAQLLGVSPL